MAWRLLNLIMAPYFLQGPPGAPPPTPLLAVHLQQHYESQWIFNTILITYLGAVRVMCLSLSLFRVTPLFQKTCDSDCHSCFAQDYVQ